MLRIETKGSWREMGRQVGEHFRDKLGECVEQFCGWFLSEPERYVVAIGKLRCLLETHAPELVEETAGLAEGSGLDETAVLVYRFFQAVENTARERCSVIYLAESLDGPLLGRNCDVEAGFSAEVQTCRIAYPEDAPATINTSYLGTPAGAGVNEYGLTLGGASAHTPVRPSGNGLPLTAIVHLVLHHAEDVGSAGSLMRKYRFSGKPAVLLLGDAVGDSVILELVPDSVPNQIPRAETQGWQACTNFFFSASVPLSVETRYLESAYARYGRIVHRLSGDVPFSRPMLKELLRDIAQPGLCVTEEVGRVRTAFSQIMEAGNCRMYLCPSHPAEAAYEEIAFLQGGRCSFELGKIFGYPSSVKGEGICQGKRLRLGWLAMVRSSIWAGIIWSRWLHWAGSKLVRSAI